MAFTRDAVGQAKGRKVGPIEAGTGYSPHIDALFSHSRRNCRLSRWFHKHALRDSAGFTGDTKLETLLKCGEPVWRETLAGGCCPGSYLRRAGGRFKTYSGFFEEWTYNFGPQQFMRILRFQNGRLMDIELGGYGY